MGNTNEGPEGNAMADSTDMSSSSMSEATMLQTRLDKELKSMVAEMIASNEFDSESDIEPEAQTALVRAAKEICYARKYYDVSKDEIIYFPNLVKTVINNSLFELADQYYHDENEEFPEEYSMGLRKVAFAKMAEGGFDYDDSDGEEEELDDKLMMRLSEPVAAVTPTAASDEKKETASEPKERPLVWKRNSAQSGAAVVSTPVSPKKGTSETSENPLIWKRGTSQTAVSPKEGPAKPLIWKLGSAQPVDLTTKVSAEKTRSEKAYSDDAPFESTGPTLVWKRASAITDEDFSFPAVDTFAAEEELPAKNQSVSEDEIQQRLGMRRQASFLRKASILDSLEKFYEPDPMTKKKPVNKENETRLARIDNEINRMIDVMLQTRDFHDETEMEVEAHEAIVKAANEVCYTHKYYDVSKDDFVYIPSVVKTITNNSLFEKADEHYEEEYEGFPEEYSLGLRKAAFARMAEEGLDYEDSDGEEEEVDFAMKMQLSQPVDLTAGGTTANKKKQNKPKVLKDKRMDASEETFVWTRSSRDMDAEETEESMTAAMAAVPEQKPMVVKTEEPLPKKPAVTEEEVQQRLGMRRQASFLRKASVLDSIGKFYGPDIMLSIKEKSAGKESETRLERIDKELNGIVEAMLQTRDFQDETDMDPEAHKAIVEAAEEICYTRKYYDASKDDFVYIPSVVKTIANNSIFEKADEHYEEEYEGFPEEYSMGLRKAAFAKMAEEGLEYEDSDGEEEEVDFATKMKLSQPVNLAAGGTSTTEKKQNKYKVLEDKRMDTSEETFVWTRSSRNMGGEESMAAAMAVVPEQRKPVVAKTEEPLAKKQAVTEEEVQQRLGMRRQASFLRKAAILDSIGKYEGEESLPAISECKRKKARPSKLMDKRMDASEETFVWARSSRNMDTDASMAAAMAAVPEQPTKPFRKEEDPSKVPAVTEAEVQQRLSMRRQASFLRKAAILEAIGKYEGEENLPVIGESSTRKKAGPSTLVDKRMDGSEETFVWTRSSRNMGAEGMAAAMAVVPVQQPVIAKTQEPPAKKPAVTEDEVQQKLGMRRQASFLRKAAILESIGKYEGEENLPAISESSTKKKAARPSKLMDKRMDASEETFVWARSSRNMDTDASMAAAMAAVPEQPTKPVRKEEDPPKAPSVTEDEVQQRLSMRRQASFIRKAAILEAIGKYEGEENLPAIGESSTKKKKAGPSTLVDKRMDGSEETFVWTRSSRNMGTDASIAFEAAPIPEQKGARKEEDAPKKPAVTEEEVQQKLGMRRQASFLRKAAILDSIGKYEGEENLPAIGESSTKKKAAPPSALVDKRMDTSEETFVWTRSSRNMGADPNIQFGSFGPGQQPMFAKKQETTVKKPTITEEDIKERLGLRRQASTVRKAAIMDSIGKWETDQNPLPETENEEGNDEGTTETAASNETSSSTDEKETPKEVSKLPLSEAAKRQVMIDDELNGMIEEMLKSEGFEEETEMEKESVDAIMKAAKEICYTKKYYDISSDKVIFFPSITKTIVQYDLFEKATEYYYEEDDEFPSDYTMGLRQIVFDRIEANGGEEDEVDMDDDMMERLAMPVQLTEDEPDPLEEAAAAVAAAEGEKENQAAEANAEQSGGDGGDQVVEPNQKSRSAKPLSEAAKRHAMINAELNGMIEEMLKSEGFEEEAEMEKESVDAIMKAAKEICYTKKYYDISSDKVIFFPSITKTIVQYDLFEKATEYYYEEDDEFPSDYTMGLRQIVFDRIEANGGEEDEVDMDDDMMERLAMPVQLTEDEPDPLEEAAAAVAAAEAERDDKSDDEAIAANAEEETSSESDKENREENAWNGSSKSEPLSMSRSSLASIRSTRSMPEPRSPFTLQPPRTAVDVGKNIAKAAVGVICFVVMDAVGLFLNSIIFPTGMF